jgi:hypothetical protein
VGAFLAVQTVFGGKLALLFVLPTLAIPIVAWREPRSMPVVLLGGACLIEQFPPANADLLTDHIPLFTSLSEGLGLTGVYVNPFELVLGLFLAILVFRGAASRALVLPRSAITLGLGALMFIVIWAEAYGLGHGGNFTFAMWELRPWLYMTLVYFITAITIKTQPPREVLLWTFVIMTGGIKSIQGIVNAIQTHNMVPRPEAILAHEEAFFFGIYMVLVAALWLWKRKGKLRFWATLFLPTVFISNLVNDRRSAWFILAGGLAMLMLLSWIRLPERRRLITRIVTVFALVFTLYTVAFWNSSSTWGQPARAVRSQIAPDARDALSNQYRVLEDDNLWINIRNSFPLGKGMGIPIDYVVPIVDLSAITALIKYVPHDNVLYIWMRMGVEGMVAFWFLIGMALITACRVVRKVDRQAAMIAVLIAASIIGYLVEGKVDYGFFWFRMAIFIGVCLGLLEGIVAQANTVPLSSLEAEAG